MAWTPADIAKLEAAIASGTKEVEYDGPPRRRIEYQDIDAMKRVLDEMKGESSANTRARYRRIETRRGLR